MKLHDKKIKKIKIVIERSSDCYGSYAENVHGINGVGDTVDEAKNSALKAIEIIKEYYPEKQIPAILKGDYEIFFKFDMESFLSLYKKTFTNAALERMTGINQK